ncbi:MAG: hypothetical protein FJY95_22310 [Candidatus Handelsmanbacteria bacterium]|nr:hypothetical protein [Candidatus Handelsmanbacteria bacterium]
MKEVDLRRTATVQALVRCLVRHLQQRRQVILEQVPTRGGPISAESRRLSNELEHLDHALGSLGQAGRLDGDID